MNLSEPVPESSKRLNCERRSQLQDDIKQTAAVTRRLTHEFRNILTSICGFAELALLKLPSDSVARRYVAEALESAREGARWSQRLQLFSQDRQQRFLPTSLVALLTEERAKPEWQSDITLHVDLPPQLPDIAVEPHLMRVVLKAILDNAREAMDGRGVVSVIARPIQLTANDCLELFGKPGPGPHVQLAIADTGIGLTAEAQQRLFRDMFFTTKGRQRGLGLVTVYGILQCYHGGFRLYSRPDRVGTTVEMFFPQGSGARNHT